MQENTIYTGTYIVFKIYRKSRRKEILKRNLTRDQAQTLVNSYPDNQKSMVCFNKQFYAQKYFKTLKTA